MKTTREVKQSSVHALHAAPRKHFSQGPFVVTVLNPTEWGSAPCLPQADPEKNLTWRELRRPWWLTKRCPELAYVPKDLTSCAVLSPFIGAPPPTEIVDGQFRLCRRSLDAWTRTETQLMAICDTLLMQVYGMAEAKFPRDSFWAEPSRFGYKEVHDTADKAHLAIKRSMNAFVALAARCSLAIALHSPPDQESTKSKWIEHLLSKDVPAWWIDDFKESHVPRFAADLRVGCYVYPDAGDMQTQWMDHVPIMARASLTVYIKWPPRERLENVFERFPWLRRLRPTNDDLLYQVPFNDAGLDRQYFSWNDLRCKLATAASPMTTKTAVGPIDDCKEPPHGHGQRPGESFVGFCARRNRENKERQAKETDQDRTARLERQKFADTHTFPDRNTRIFVWEEMEVYHENVRGEWAALDYRHLLEGRMRRARWDDHGLSQRRYDAFRNEWDLCKNLDPNHIAYVDSESTNDDYDHEHITVNTSLPQRRPRPPQPHASTAETATPAPSQRAEFLNFMHLYYRENKAGFIPSFDKPITIIQSRFGVVTDYSQNPAFLANDCHPDKLRLILGSLPVSPDVRLDLDADTLHSFRGWAGGMAITSTSPTPPSAPEVLWDLHPRNKAYLSLPENRHPKMQMSIKWLNRAMWYMIDYQDDEPLEWSLIVDNATTALELLRRRNIKNRRQAAKFLAQRGMAFRTIMVPDPRRVGRLDPIPSTVLGFRGVDAKFDSIDFRAYWRRAHDLLYPLRGRAAVLKGGIVWRIALELWGPSLLEAAINGPSENVYDTGQVFRPSRGPDYLDDQLTESEIDVICGVYRVLTGHSSTQEKHQSWWPRPNAWSGSPYDTGFWTPIAEIWFQNRLSKIRSGDTQPYSVQQWKRKLNSAKIAGWVQNSVETVSKDYIHNDLRPCES